MKYLLFILYFKSVIPTFHLFKGMFFFIKNFKKMIILIYFYNLNNKITLYI